MPGKKKAKDLDPKAKSKKVKGGGLEQDEKNLARDVRRVRSFADKTAVQPVKNSPKTVKDGIRRV